MPVAEAEPKVSDAALVAAPAEPFAAVFNRGELLAALKGAATLADDRAFRPILSCVRIATDGAGVTVEATNTEQAARWRLSQVQVESPGVLCVPAAKFLKAVDRLPDETVRFAADEVALTVAGKFSHRINRHAAAVWPATAEFPEAAGTVAGADLLRVIRQTMPCAAKAATRYAFNGVLFGCLPAKGKVSRLICAATDGRRAAATECPFAFGKGERLPNVILPAVALDRLSKFTDPESEVGVWWGENAAAFHGPDWALRTNLLEGTFPPYEDVFPKDPDKALTADAVELAEAIEQACLLSDEREGKGNDRPSMAIELGPHGFRGHSQDPVAGTRSEAALACRYEGKPMTIGFHGPWLAAGIRAAEVPDGQEITVRFSAPNRPAFIERPGYRFIVMPVNLQR